MEKIELVIQKLRQENYHPRIETDTSFNEEEWSEILWVNEHNDECFIYQDNIAIEANKLAWFQSSRDDYHLLKIYEGDVLFTWVPETYNPVFGCYCQLLEWYKQHLLFVYQEKHQIYICSIQSGQVNYFSFHGEELARKGDCFSFATYADSKAEKVSLLKVPELTLLEPIDRAEAEIRGLIPEGLNRPGSFLSAE